MTMRLLGRHRLPLKKLYYSSFNITTPAQTFPCTHWFCYNKLEHTQQQHKMLSASYSAALPPNSRETNAVATTGYPFRSSRVAQPVCGTVYRSLRRGHRETLGCFFELCWPQRVSELGRQSTSQQFLLSASEGQALRQLVQYWDVSALCMAWELRSKVMKLMPTAMGPLIQFMLSPLYRPPMSPSLR